MKNTTQNAQTNQSPSLYYVLKIVCVLFFFYLNSRIQIIILLFHFHVHGEFGVLLFCYDLDMHFFFTLAWVLLRSGVGLSYPVVPKINKQTKIAFVFIVSLYSLCLLSFLSVSSLSLCVYILGFAIVLYLILSLFSTYLGYDYVVFFRHCILLLDEFDHESFNQFVCLFLFFLPWSFYHWHACTKKHTELFCFFF